MHSQLGAATARVTLVTTTITARIQLLSFRPLSSTALTKSLLWSSSRRRALLVSLSYFSTTTTTTATTNNPQKQPRCSTTRANTLPPRPTLPDHELKLTYLKGSGPGGQKINKTSSAVQLTHLPTGLVVKSQATRSRSQNHTIARRILAEKIELLTKGDGSRVAKRIERAQRKKASASKKTRRKYRKLKEGETKESEVAAAAAAAASVTVVVNDVLLDEVGDELEEGEEEDGEEDDETQTATVDREDLLPVLLESDVERQVPPVQNSEIGDEQPLPKS